MALTNQQRVGKGLDTLAEGLRPFVEREMKSVHGKNWSPKSPEGRPLLVGDTWDSAALLKVMWDHWNDVFRKTLSQADRSVVSELRDVRNRWAHQNPFSSDDTYRALDSIHRLLQAVSAPEAKEADRQKQEVMRLKYEEQARQETRKVAATAIRTDVAESAGLKPWRELITPHPDVHAGRYQQAEFAADLGQVYRGEGSDEYRDPKQFFARTFITEGMKNLLGGAIERLSGTGGDPVVELQTNFGGGKTHSMIALFHLFSGEKPGALAGVEGLMESAGLDSIPKANRAVLVGVAMNPAAPDKKKDGTVVRTMWGELAWQLLGKKGYAMVAEADENGVSPGSDTLRRLFAEAEPCAVLIDEWVTYARQLVGKDGLSGGTFDASLSFAQALTEGARAMKKTLVVASIPSSDIEIGGEAGHETLTRLKNVFGRLESPWRPATAEESFEIVRRRLFQPMDGENFRHRDAVIREFAKLYQKQKSEFPRGCGEGTYEERMRASYPIHPELFDRLYEDWSTLERFQRTRGVLRLMASVIHGLWKRDDRSLMILPANVPIDDSDTMEELTRYLEDAWKPVIEKDVDGPHSLPLQLDNDNPNFGRYSACRRVARVIYLGSAPKQKTSSRGIEDVNIMLGCVQPGEAVSTFGDALRRLTDRGTHLYVNENRYWFDTQPSINRIAQDRAASLSADAVYQEIVKRLGDDRKRRGDFEAVHIVEREADSSDVPDEPEARLVILGPDAPHVAKATESSALALAKSVLDHRGSSPRTYRNALAFLCADEKRIDDLTQAVRSFLAWRSIHDEENELNLDTFGRKQATTKAAESEKAILSRLPETYTWAIVPEQKETTGPIAMTEVKVSGDGSLAERTSKKMVREELLIREFGGVRLRMELDRIPLWRGDRVDVRQLRDDFFQYLYLPRLRNSDVLLESVRDGAGMIHWESDGFAYAGFYNEDVERYMGLCAGPAKTANPELGGVVVKAEVARRQLDAQATTVAETIRNGEAGVSVNASAGVGAHADVEKRKVTKRFWATKDLDAVRFGKETGQISEAVVQHLAGLTKAKVKIAIEISAEVADGIPDHVERTVGENCRTLGMDFEFEKE